MYFPYLRGRQYELIALRELINNDKLSEHITPIIEPVKVSPTLLSVINTFNKKGRNLIIITNPHVGTYESDSKKEKNVVIFENIQKAANSQNIYSGIITDEISPFLVNKMLDQGINYNKMVALCLNSDNIENLQAAFSRGNALYNVIPYSPAFRRVRNSNRVMIDDKFNKLPRNSDYLNCLDEFFSDDHLYCYEDGYSGFSDYSIVGEEYNESGFAPYAVAIHIVYMDTDSSLRIHHFVA